MTYYEQSSSDRKPTSERIGGREQYGGNLQRRSAIVWCDGVCIELSTPCEEPIISRVASYTVLDYHLHYHDAILRQTLRKLPFLSANNGMASCMSQQLCAVIYLPRTPYRFDEPESCNDCRTRREPKTPKESHHNKATREVLSAFNTLVIWRMARGSHQSLESWHVIVPFTLLRSNLCEIAHDLPTKKKGGGIFDERITCEETRESLSCLSEPHLSRWDS